MSLNKSLIITFCVLTLLVIVTVINLNRSKSVSSSDYENKDDEALMMNISHVPEIVRSYEKVKDIYGKKNILIFRFVSTTCNICKYNQLNELLIFQDEIGKENVWVFPAYPDDRNSRIQLSAELAKFNYRNIPADSLIIPAYEGEQKSYFAWINNEGEIDRVFIPDRSNVLLTRKYFLEVKKIILKLGEE